MAHVGFGSKADIATSPTNLRFGSKADIAGRPQSAAPRLWSATLLASGTSATLSFGFPALGFAADLLHFHRLAKTRPWYK
jgi:hypothetical protein